MGVRESSEKARVEGRNVAAKRAVVVKVERMTKASKRERKEKG